MMSVASTSELRAALQALAYDLAFVSTPEAAELFRRLDAGAFERDNRNPVALVAGLPDSVLEEAFANGLAASVSGFASERAAAQARSWWGREHAGHPLLVAYFCMEFGLHDSLPIYSGGLGVLAGDHLKAASGLGVPQVGVGLFYRNGYFRQSLAVDGTQAEAYEANDPRLLPLMLERDEDGKPQSVEVIVGDEPVVAQIWRAEVGNAQLYLLDSDVEGNSRDARQVTDVLYGGDREHRLRQEVLLGVGGPRALAALGLRPTVFHVNEGHSAFLALERMRAFVEEGGLAPTDALERVRSSTTFTTHTPVPAGNEVFPADLVARYLGPLARRCGMSTEELLALGSTDDRSSFGMTEFALRTSARANAVSALHGTVSREMWSALWPERSPEEAPITHVTNGVHAPTWVSGELAGLLRSAGVGLDAAPSEAGWTRAAGIDEQVLWEIHGRRRDALLASLPQGGLDPGALTIGFARRFAAYKRAWLLFSEPERLRRLLSDAERPVQVVVAGKAHPGDDEGKSILAELVRFARDPRSAGRVVFVEDYDMGLAKLLVQGVDLWLTTPRRPNEASGTSGMKAGLNGVLNLSVLDGWWPEAYTPEIGWAIGERFSEQGDEAEAAELFRLLEAEVVPTFFDRDENGVPPRWVKMMKASISRIGGRFHAERMVVEYVEQLYLPVHEAASAQV